MNKQYVKKPSGRKTNPYYIEEKQIAMDTILTIRIDKELEQLLEEASTRSGQSKSEWVRQALKRQLSIESFQKLRKELLPYGEAQGWLTDEDVFREVT